MTPARLRRWRSENDYSQSRLAEALGVAIMTVSRWERGEREIPPFLHLALECLKMKGSECLQRVKRQKPGPYQYVPLNDRVMILREGPAAGQTKKNTKRS